ncbi:specific transcription factor domain protein [Aspergillus parasiticus SU-1]|uniref:Specific transcription factor domain protein n=1 Tax=Aspergillus parasiticus (strain ATCC 56775 / NRRL 5862 / SRRC 143 / SU-1) TaxID=1403190 RepID=A0A0F0IE12_ASPPU|nr:specific transcription factor domain protein [Aspergillus parasiticus SU-1]
MLSLYISDVHTPWSSDILRRHMRRVHAVDGPVSQTRRACSNCRSLKSRCEGGPPCHDCIRRKIPCFPSVLRRTNRRDSRGSLTERPQLPSQGSSPSAGSWKKQCFVDLYFEKFHPYWPFIHRGSFNGFNETPLLAQSVMVIGLWLSGERSAQSAALDLHKTLGLAIRQQKEVWDASGVEGACSDCSWPIPTYQAILLHIIFALLHRGGGSMGLDLKPSLPSPDSELLDSLVGSCQRLGMFYYPNMLARYQSDDLASYVWVSIEEVKRFDLALYKFHRMLSRAGARDSAAGSYSVTTVDGALTAADLRFPMPTNDALWHAVGKEQWLSATTKGVYLCSLNDAMEDQWISNSAELIGFLF